MKTPTEIREASEEGARVACKLQEAGYDDAAAATKRFAGFCDAAAYLLDTELIPAAEELSGIWDAVARGDAAAISLEVDLWRERLAESIADPRAQNR